jgi:hypothetical protein
MSQAASDLRAMPATEARRASRLAHLLRDRGVVWWEIAVALAGVAAASAAVAVTLNAGFLAYPGWLALQKADLILGPIGVGLYWHRRRPHSRFGPLLIAYGFVHVPYILESAPNDVLFTIGVHWEGIIYLATLAVILSFPSGRLRGRLDRLILVLGAVAAVLPSSLITVLSPHIYAGGSISACKAACPDNALSIAANPELVTRLFDIERVAVITLALATAGLLLRRLFTGTPPQRRALAIGTPVALVFLFIQAAYQIAVWLGAEDAHVLDVVRWSFAAARSLLWCGFLFALIAAQLFAARVLRQMVGASLRRPTLRELEDFLRRPLGDPMLRLAWIDGHGGPPERPRPGDRRAARSRPRHLSGPARRRRPRPALEAVSRRAGRPVDFAGEGVGRYASCGGDRAARARRRRPAQLRDPRRRRGLRLRRRRRRGPAQHSRPARGARPPPRDRVAARRGDGRPRRRAAART